MSENQMSIVGLTIFGIVLILSIKSCGQNYTRVSCFENTQKTECFTEPGDVK